MSLVFDTSLYMNGGAGGGVSLDKIIVKSATIPTAAIKYVGAVYQYVGETNSTYTHGYIYECVSSQSTLARAVYTPAYFVFDENRGSLVNFFSEITDDYLQVVSGRFKYLQAGDIWNINGLDENGNTVFSNYQLYTQDLIDAGFTFIVPMEDIADEAEVSYELRYFTQTNYAWERIDVQPAAEMGRYLSGWNCTTGLADTNPPESPYVYKTGDYFIVTAASFDGTNYRPSGTQYVTGTASTTVETQKVSVKDTYLFDGTNWTLLKTSDNVIVDNSTIIKDGVGRLVVVGAKNKRSNTNQTLKIWQGDQSQYSEDRNGKAAEYAWVYSGMYLGVTSTANPSVGDILYSSGSELEITETDGSTYVIAASARWERTPEYDEGPIAPIIDSNDICFINGVGVKVGNTLIADNTDTSTLLQNTATGSNSLTILGTPASNSSSINIGVNSSASRTNSVVIGNAATSADSMCTNIGASSSTDYRSVSVGYSSQSSQDSVAIGSSARATAKYTTAIGQNSGADQQNAIAIGTSAKAQAQGAIQIGGKTNTDPNTLYCGTYGYNNYKLLDLTTGLIPDARLSTNVQTTSNLVTSVSSTSTDTQYPSAKLFYDTCGDIETLINAL